MNGLGITADDSERYVKLEEFYNATPQTDPQLPFAKQKPGETALCNKVRIKPRETCRKIEERVHKEDILLVISMI
jgi:hypothetical protein